MAGITELRWRNRWLRLQSFGRWSGSKPMDHLCRDQLQNPLGFRKILIQSSGWKIDETEEKTSPATTSFCTWHPLGACSNKFAMANPVKSGTTGDKSRVGDSDFRVLFWGREDEMWGGNQSWAQWRTEKRGLAQQAQQRRLSVSLIC